MVAGEDVTGRVLDDRYRVGMRIASGGMADVHVGTDIRLDREVAIKILHRGLDESLNTFTAEAKAAARLNHRGIVAIYDQGTDDDVTYIVMEYVPGRTLRDVMVAEAPMAPMRALHHLEAVLVALSAAHSAGLVHRDIKPENVLISESGETKLADFGLARPSTASTGPEGQLIGTMSYVAPEIVTRQRTDTRADVYACGAILYEMLTGVKPHQADSPIQVAHKHVHEDIGKPSLRVDGIPDYLDALVARATSRDLAARSVDARTLLHQVRQVQHALAAGITADPELTADLAPGVGPTPPVLPRLPSRPAATDTEATEAHRWSDGDQAAANWIESGEPTRTFGQASIEPAEVPSPQSHTGSDEGPNQPQIYPRRSRKGAFWLVVALVAFLLVGFLSWYWAVGRYDDTPNLVGLTLDEATTQIDEAGLGIEQAPKEFSETIAKGHVIETDPEPGSRILAGDVVTVTVSKGKERYKIPNLEGKTLEEARTILGSRNLVVGQTNEEWHDSIAKDSVIAVVAPEVGKKVKRDTSVDLLISKGREPVEIVSQIGKKQKTAVEALQVAGFLVKIDEKFSDDVRKGDVMGQLPESGTAFKGDTVTLVVSKGPEMIAVPDLEGMTEAQARQAVEAAGFELNPTSNPLASDGATVRFQNPRPGSKHRRGTTITVFIT